MFGRRIRLFKLLGFGVNIDLSWVVLALLITWSLAQGFFPYHYEGYPAVTYWFMGAAGAVGMFASIIFHELCHSLVARRFGLPMQGITLFIFGGVAEMDREPPSPKAEFFMAIAGPVSSILLGSTGIFAISAGETRLPLAAMGVLEYVTVINFILAGFNLVPAFPLDGGRVLRSALWQWKKDFRWATRIASRIGSFFGTVLMLLGIVNVMRGNVVGGLWQVMIGWFLGNAARMSYQQILARRVLEGGTVRQFMSTSPVSVPSSVSLRDFAEGYVYRYHHKLFPVVDRTALAGSVTARRLYEIPQSDWERMTVGEIAVPLSPEITIGPDVDAVRALGIMSRSANSRLLVVENGLLVGIITLKDIMELFSSKLDLGDKEK